MPAAAETSPHLPLQRTARRSTAALAATLASGLLPHTAVDDRALITDLIGPAHAAMVSETLVGELLEASGEHLAGLGLKPAARRRLLAASELARRFQPAMKPPPPLRTARDLLPHLAGMRRARTETLGVLSLDAHCCLVGGLALVAEGGLMHVAVAAREVYAPALERCAAAIVMAHNHPSGSLEPSSEDVAFTRVMGRAGAILGIRLLDHLVVARRGYLSLREAGLWEPQRCAQLDRLVDEPDQ